jgi:quercetin dioxygenase-like cupin family protein
MKITRRNLAWLMPALAAAQKQAMPSKCFRRDDLPVKVNGENRSRDVFKGETHAGFALDMHETDLAAGAMPHASHHHEHEELMVLREGTLEVTIAGKTSRVSGGDVVYVASNEEHGWKNVGTTRARYYVMALGRK